MYTELLRGISDSCILKKFLTQFGITDNPELKHWHNENIKDDEDKKMGIKKNYVSFAGGGKNSRIQKYNKKIIKPLIVYKKLTLLEHHLQKIKEIKKKNVFINLHKNIKKFTSQEEIL